MDSKNILFEITTQKNIIHLWNILTCVGNMRFLRVSSRYNYIYCHLTTKFSYEGETECDFKTEVNAQGHFVVFCNMSTCI